MPCSEHGILFPSCASAELAEYFTLSNKKGKWIEKLYGKFSLSYRKCDQGMNQALATKYRSYLSRRKYAFLCKIQSSTLIPKIKN